MKDEFDLASDALADARLEFGIAEANLAAARSELTRAERRMSLAWRKKALPHQSSEEK